MRGGQRHSRTPNLEWKRCRLTGCSTRTAKAVRAFSALVPWPPVNSDVRLLPFFRCSLVRTPRACKHRASCKCLTSESIVTAVLLPRCSTGRAHAARPPTRRGWQRPEAARDAPRAFTRCARAAGQRLARQIVGVARIKPTSLADAAPVSLPQLTPGATKVPNGLVNTDAQVRPRLQRSWSLCAGYLQRYAAAQSIVAPAKVSEQ